MIEAISDATKEIEHNTMGEHLMSKRSQYYSLDTETASIAWLKRNTSEMVAWIYAASVYVQERCPCALDDIGHLKPKMDKASHVCES